MLEIKNLNFYYGNNHILKNISFNAESGSLWGLMGPNGSGKTTFFKCILGLLKHTGSQIKINHLDYEKLNTSKLAKLISYVPQEHKPPFPFTVREMILMGRSPYMGGIFGLKKEDYIEAEKAIEMVNIADISDKPVTALSGGQRQLTLIARSIAQNAPVMILDEPTSALDFNNQITIWKILKKLAETGKLIIACSHDPNHILWFAENTLVIKNGEILANGKTDDVITNSLLKEIYGIEYNILHNNNSKIIQPVL